MLLLAIAAIAGMTGEMPPRCMAVSRAVLEGAQLVAADIGHVQDCPAHKVERAVRFDRANASTFAVRDLAAGEIIAEIPTFALPDVRRGDALFLRARIGAIMVERPVTALQSASPGHRLFVTTNDGAVIAAAFERRAP